MSNYGNNQPHYPYNNSYTILNAAQQQGLNHRSSFDNGDDTAMFGQNNAQQQPQYYGYGQSPQGHGQQSGYSQSSLPYRAPSQGPLGGYQHQSQPAAPAHASYNPAQYQPQNSYNPQSYGSPQANTYSIGGGYNSNYQPYVPAAYGEQSVNRTASMYNSHYATSPPTQYGTAPPPPPGRPHFNSAPAASYPSDASHGYHHQSNQYLGMPSPPAPAPPPHQESLGPVRAYSHAGTSYDHHGQYSSLPSPDINRQHSNASRISAQYSSSPQPSSGGLPSRTPSQGNNYGRHPQGSTLPGLPSESESDGELYLSHNSGDMGDLMHDINAALGTSSTHGYNNERQRDPLFSPASPQFALSPDERPTHDGILSTGDTHINYGAFANDSDAEAAAGLAAMAAADEQEAAEDARRRSSHISNSNVQFSDKERSDDSDYAGYGDLSLAGGGYAGTMHYGDDLPAVRTSTHFSPKDQQTQRMNSMRSSGMSSDSQSNGGYDSQPFPRLQPDTARVDAGGTGGLTEPSTHARRLSYDEGDEGALSDVGESGDGIPDLFFHPGMSPNRPLPPPPARSGSDAGSRATQHLSASHALHSNRHSAYDTIQRYPGTPDAFNHEALSPAMVPRSTSLLSNRSQPRMEQPMRSKTDADRARILKQQELSRSHSDGYDINTPRSDADVGTLDLPAIPRKKFDPSKISTDVFKKCTEPWAMSSIFSWLRSLTDEETELKESAVTEAIAALFTNKVPTMSSIDAEKLAQEFVQNMYSSKVLQKDEEWVKFAHDESEISGVLYQLTGLGCYSSKLHMTESQNKCYSRQCMRTVRKADFEIPETLKTIEWHEMWKLTAEQVASKGGKEREKQFNLREMVDSEDTFLYGLKLLKTLYVEDLSTTDIIPEKRRAAFIRNTFESAENCRKVNQEFLAPQLKYRENEQGPWVVGYSDIIREWIRRARPIYVEYAAKFPKADLLVREELKRNPSFANYMEEARKRPASGRLAWDHYLKTPLTKIQRMILQMETILKNSVAQDAENSQERTNLMFAIDEVKVCAHEMDARVNEVNKAVELLAYKTKLRFRRQQGDDVDLALDQLGRTIVLKSDLMRQGTKGVNWVNCHAILFDHYLVLAKPQRDITGDGYDVSKPPIPMGLISLESTNDPAVQRSSVRGVVTAAPGQMGPRGIDPRLARTTSSQSGSLTHTSTGLTQGSGGSGSGIGVPSNIDNDSNENKIYYPFKVKHLGRTEVYTLYAPTAERRNEWCEAIISTKTQHAEALYAQNAEPFKLRVLADTAFGLESYAFAGKRISIRGTPLDRAVREVEKKYTGAGRPAPVSRAAVNCATVFQQSGGRVMCAVGTDAGVYFSEYTNPRGWVRAIQMNKVSQIAVLEDFNLLILLSDKVLIAYHLDVVCPANGPPVPQTDSSVRKAPQKLSGNKDVGFFLAGKMKDRVLVFYQKKDGINSIFKILEPVLQKSATSKSKWLGGSSRRGQTEFFRDYDEFYIPAETYGLNAFHSSLAVATKRGMEVLTLDKKITWGVPNLDSHEEETRIRLSTIAARLKDLRPLGMFRLSDAEFLVAFSECAVYVNKLGDISRSVIMEFVGRANTACLYYPYLVLFNDDFVEIRDAQNGRMKQVIAGQGIRMLDDGGNYTPGQVPARTVKLSMQHPEHEKSYVVVEMLMRTEQQ